MSGFLAIFRRDKQPVPIEALQQALPLLSLRGPDRSNQWHENEIGLAHSLLCTTPESLSEAQPAVDPSGRFVIAADARLDNRKELINRLGLPPEAITWPDCALILSAFERWGTIAPAHLIGDFAFVIWDRQEHRLFGARDPIGVKPFFYATVGKTIVCASAVEPILSIPEIPDTLNELHLGAFLAKQFADREATFYQHIRRLPATCALVATPSSIRTWTYWEPDYEKRLSLKNDTAYSEHFFSIFKEAVESRLRSAYPIGATLSGGLDSSSVAAVADEMLDHEQLHTFSAIFPSLAMESPLIDERPYIREMLSSRPFIPHLIEADTLNPLVNNFWSGAEPMPGINLYLDHAFGEEARRQDIRVILTGHDGDSTVSHGYELFPTLLRQGRWLKLYQECRALAQLTGRSLGQITWRLAIRPYRDAWRSAEPINEADFYRQHAINPTFASRIRLFEYLAVHRPVEPAPFNRPQDHWAGLTAGIFAYGTELLDRLLSSYGIEPRHPYTDRRLIEFCLALPVTQRFHNGWNRMIVRRTMDRHRLLPPKVCWRRDKGDLSASFQTNLLNHNLPLLEQLVNGSSLDPRLQEALDLSALGTIFQNYLVDPLRQSSAAMTIEFAAVLNHWFKRHTLVEKPPVKAAAGT